MILASKSDTMLRILPMGEVVACTDTCKLDAASATIVAFIVGYLEKGKKDGSTPAQH